MNFGGLLWATRGIICASSPAAPGLNLDVADIYQQHRLEQWTVACLSPSGATALLESATKRFLELKSKVDLKIGSTKNDCQASQIRIYAE